MRWLLFVAVVGCSEPSVGVVAEQVEGPEIADAKKLADCDLDEGRAGLAWELRRDCGKPHRPIRWTTSSPLGAMEEWTYCVNGKESECRRQIVVYLQLDVISFVVSDVLAREP